ncbi:hypothetical protein [Lentzea roselyniae]|uniref:hypothetical protein n=1 Tax=Lentzea roselyniae TaxID=531940 RepID=UPI0031F8F9BE
MTGGSVRELVTTHWWRTVPVVAAVIITAWGDVSMLAVLPTLVWCVALARTRRGDARTPHVSGLHPG